MHSLGLIAAYVVLLGASSLLGFLGKPTEMGLAIIAGSIGLAFSNIDKIARFKGAGFEAEMREKIEAIVEKETEPEPETVKRTHQIAGYKIDQDTRKVLGALSNPSYTWRYLGGVGEETGLKKDNARSILSWLVANGFAAESKGANGTVWSLTNKGRNIHILIQMDEKKT